MLAWFDQAWELDSRERREARRLEVKDEVMAVLPPDRPVPCTLTEVSLAGFRLAAPDPLPLNTRLHLHVSRKPGGEPDLKFPAQIIWNRKTQRKTLPVECGGRFGALGKAERFNLVERFFSDPGFDLADVGERRRHIRVLREASIGDKHLVIRDISESGMGLLAREPYRVSEPIEVQLHLTHTPIPCQGRVVSCAESGDRSYYRIGVKFDRMEEPFRKHLLQALADLMKQQVR